MSDGVRGNGRGRSMSGGVRMGGLLRCGCGCGSKGVGR